MTDDLIPWLRRLHAESAMTGWDFGALDGRLDPDPTPWDFESESRAALASASRAVDVGTGGGERLLALLGSLDGSAPEVVATEGWADNVPVARAALAPYGVEVLEYDPEAHERLPLDDDAVDLVLNRHEAFDATEFARVLRPGGRVLTQQVDGRDAQELREWFGGDPLCPDVTLERFAADLEEAGFRIDAADDWSGSMRFRDVGTLVEYLALVPWDVPGFDVDDAADQLRQLARLRPITVTQRRFRIAATRRRDG